jgi:hypothetical protein
MDESNSCSPNDRKNSTKLEKNNVTLSVHLSHCLFHENEEVVLETARVLGQIYYDFLLPA